jgi:hypothetical protein
VFDWRINSRTNSFEFGSEPPTTGANSGGNSPDFEHYEVRIYSPRHLDAVGNELLIRKATTKISSYRFSFDENRECQFGPHRDFIFEVVAKDKANNLSAPVPIRVSNPHPPAPAGVLVTVSADRVSFQFPSSGQADFAGYRVWLEETAGFNPATTEPKYEGSANPISLLVEAGKTYYYRLAEYDVFSTWAEYANFTTGELNEIISAQGTFNT